MIRRPSVCTQVQSFRGIHHSFQTSSSLFHNIFMKGIFNVKNGS